MNLHHQVVGVRYAHEYLDASTLETKPGGYQVTSQLGLYSKLKVSLGKIAIL